MLKMAKKNRKGRRKSKHRRLPPKENEDESSSSFSSAERGISAGNEEHTPTSNTNLNHCTEEGVSGKRKMDSALLSSSISTADKPCHGLTSHSKSAEPAIDGERPRKKRRKKRKRSTERQTTEIKPENGRSDLFVTLLLLHVSKPSGLHFSQSDLVNTRARMSVRIMFLQSKWL